MTDEELKKRLDRIEAFLAAVIMINVAIFFFVGIGVKLILVHLK